MRAAIASILFLTACNQWVRPRPEPGRPRDGYDQHLAAVRVVASCPGEYEGHASSGVMVSDWQVLTALHSVDCQSAVVTVRIETPDGGRWRMVPEREWRDADVARLQLLSSDSVSPYPGNVAVGRRPSADDVLWMHPAHPWHSELRGVAYGWTYSGPSSGGDTGWFAYRIFSEPGNSGAGIYDDDGLLIGIHLGAWGGEKYGAVVSPMMVPGN